MGKGKSAVKIKKKCKEITKMLIAKNKSYGENALHPIAIFGSGIAIDGLHTRIDDKLSRIKYAPGAFGDNDLRDLIGYLILLEIAREDG